MLQDKTVIYVDDEEINLLIFWETFKYDMNLKTFNNPEEALDYMKNNYVDLVLTDQQMPSILGADFLINLDKESIKNKPKKSLFLGMMIMRRSTKH